MYKIIKWTKHITDDGKDKVISGKPKDLSFKFRLLDDDGYIYAYGYSDNSNSFAPLDTWGAAYGATEIQYMNHTGEWETL